MDETLQLGIYGFTVIAFGGAVWILACWVTGQDPLGFPKKLLGSSENKIVTITNVPEDKQKKITVPSKHYSEMVREVITVRKDARTGKPIIRIKNTKGDLSDFEMLADPLFFHPKDVIQFLTGDSFSPELVYSEESTLARLQQQNDDLLIQVQAYKSKQTDMMTDDKLRLHALAETNREARRVMYGNPGFQSNSSPFGLSRFSRPWNNYGGQSGESEISQD